MTATAKVLLYSDDRIVREQVRLALGKRVAATCPSSRWSTRRRRPR